MSRPSLPDAAPSGKALAPPIFYLAGVGALREGDHTHDAWHARVVHPDLPSHSLGMIVKALRSPVTLAVEVACGLAAKELRLNVPHSGLVIAHRDQIPGIDDEHIGERVLLAGSHYQRPDALFAEAVADSPAAEELIWSKVCESPVARQGAAWDELIANPDRHCENVLFDGSTWWLFDHDQALPPAATYASSENDAEARNHAIAYSAKENLLAAELMRRYRGQYEVIQTHTKKMTDAGKRLQALARFSRDWTHPDAEIRAVLELVGIVLGLIHLRLPALAEKLHLRLGPGTPPADLFHGSSSRTKPS